MSHHSTGKSTYNNSSVLLILLNKFTQTETYCTPSQHFLFQIKWGQLCLGVSDTWYHMTWSKNRTVIQQQMSQYLTEVCISIITCSDALNIPATMNKNMHEILNVIYLNVITICIVTDTVFTYWLCFKNIHLVTLSQGIGIKTGGPLSKFKLCEKIIILWTGK